MILCKKDKKDPPPSPKEKDLPPEMWLCMKWYDVMHGYMVYTELAETAAVSRGTSHVTTKQHWKHITSVDIQNAQ